MEKSREETASTGVTKDMEGAERLRAEDCLRRARQGDVKAFEQFYLLCYHRIFNYLFRFLGDYHGAEEAVQEVFIRAYRNLWRYQERHTPLAWIYTIARHLALNKIRALRLRRHLSLEGPAAGQDGQTPLGEMIPGDQESPQAAAARREEVRLLNRVLLSMPALQREILILCDIQECDYREVAGILGVPVGTVGSRLSRARRKLAEKLERLK